MSHVGVIALHFTMALSKEQSKHPAKCFHCNYILNGMEKEGAMLLVHEENCDMLAALRLVREYEMELSGQCIGAMA